MKNNINDNFFSKPNLLNSYWAGFIAADGNINKPSKSKIYNRISIGLSIKDISHLKTLKSSIKTNANVMLGVKNDGTGNFHKTCTLTITNKKLVFDLKNNFNIVPKKSLKLKPPKGLTKQQALAYIIGYIDGDGCIGNYFNGTRRKKYTIIRILGTKNLLNFIQNTLKSAYKIDNKSKVNKKTNSNIFVLSYNGEYAKIIIKNLRKIKVPKLNRKWEYEF